MLLSPVPCGGRPCSAPSAFEVFFVPAWLPRGVVAFVARLSSRREVARLLWLWRRIRRSSAAVSFLARSRCRVGSLRWLSGLPCSVWVRAAGRGSAPLVRRFSFRPLPWLVTVSRFPWACGA